MYRKASLLLTLAAWFLATGEQWDALQTFAWARMFAANVHALPIGAALTRTFSPEGRCKICEAIARAKEQQEDSTSVPDGKFGGKIVLFCQPAPTPVVAAPAFSSWSLRDPLVQTIARAAPPLRPPRAPA